MTIKEAFTQFDVWIAPLPINQRESVQDWWYANFPQDGPVKVANANAETVCFFPFEFRLKFGIPYLDGQDPKQLYVQNVTRVRDALLQIKERRITIPVTGYETGVLDKSFYVWNGGVFIPILGFLSNAEFINLASFVRNDPDPSV